MSSEQGPSDVLGELAQREARRFVRPLCPLCGTRGMCSTCNPTAFQRAVEAEMHKGLAEGKIAGVELSARARRTAERYLAERARARQAGGRAA